MTSGRTGSQAHTMRVDAKGTPDDRGQSSLAGVINPGAVNVLPTIHRYLRSDLGACSVPGSFVCQ